MKKLPVFDMTETDIRVLFAAAIAYKSMELNQFLDVDNVDVWNRYIGEAQMLIDYLTVEDLWESPHRCATCGYFYDSAAGAAKCVREHQMLQLHEAWQRAKEDDGE